MSMGVNVVLPLSAEIRQAYEDLYDKNQAAIGSTTDTGLLDSFSDTQEDIGEVLSADDEYRIEQNTVTYEAVLGKISEANDQLDDLKKRVDAVTDGLGVFAEVLGAAAKVIGMVG